MKQHQAGWCAVVIDSVGFTYTSSVSDMVTADFTPEREKTKSLMS